MLVILVGIALGIGLMVWIWKVPISKTVSLLKQGGSSTFEAYFLIALISVATIAAIYLLISVL